MSLHVLEFNDAGLRLSDANGILLDSPGYAYVNAKEVEFGENARKQSKVHPLSSFNQFWHKLSLDPFSKSIGHFRHNADIAFSHLQDIARSSQFEGDVVLAVPGSFSREQLGILLGLLKQSPMRPVGLADAALLGGMEKNVSDSAIHVELHLHQVVLSKLQRVGEELRRESVLLVPGAGWMNISDNLMQLFTSAFIQQCRFNPQHNAASEQMLLDNLPQWLIEENEEGSDDGSNSQESRSSLEIKLNHNNIVHQANLSRSALHNRLLPFFQKILQQLELIDPAGNSPLLVSDRMQCLPGFEAAVTNSSPRTVSLLGENCVTDACLRYSDELIGSPDALHFVSAIKDEQASVSISNPSQGKKAAIPTHCLCQHRAHRLADGVMIYASKQANESEQSLHLIRRGKQEDYTDMQLVGELVQEDEGFILLSQNMLINDKPAEDRQALKLGDVLRAAGLTQSIELILVQEQDEQ